MKIFFIVLSLFLTCAVEAQVKMRDVIKQMPDTLVPYLKQNARLDFIDFMDSDMKAEVNNRLEGKSEMTKLTEDFLEVKMSEQSTFQLKVLTKTDGTQLLCAVSTVCGPVCDSHIDFYTTDWQLLDANALLPKLPTLNNFLKPLPEDASYTLRDAFRQADLLLMKADLSADNSTLSFTLTTPEYMDAEAAKLLAPYVVPTVTLQWNGESFQ